MRIMLVDDKESVVEGIRKHVQWERLGVTAIEIARDGKEAMDIYSSFLPDLIITDIKMPNLSGIQLMEKLREQAPFLRFVVLSGYEEFEFAKQAMSLGASAYLLKPVDIQELTAIVEKVLLDIRLQKEQGQQRILFQQKIRRSLPALRNQYLSEMIHFRDPYLPRLKDKWDYAEIPLLPSDIGLLALEIDQFAEISQKPVEEVELARFIVENIISECITTWGNGIAFYSEWSRLTLLINYDPEQPEREIKEAHLQFADYCRKSIENHSKITVTIGVSSLCPELRQLPDAYQQACQAIEHTYFFGSNQVVHFEDLLHYHGKRAAYPASLEQELLTLVRRGQVELVRHAVHAFFEEQKQSDGTPLEIRSSCMQLVTVLNRLLFDIGIKEDQAENKLVSWYSSCESSNLPELHEFILEWFQEAANLVRLFIQAGSKNIIAQTKDYIRLNLLQPVSLSAVADHVGVSANYLSSLFKKETGISFIEYLTEIKLVQAKEWLLDDNVPIYEISERLGYLDRKYFREIFKKKTGVTPSEFRASLGKV